MNPVQSLADETLIALRRGDERAYERLFRTHYASLCGYAYTFLRDDAEAEEVAQTVFLILWEKHASLDITVSLKAYLYRAVHNQALNRIKHLRIREGHRQLVTATAEPGYEGVAQQVIGTELEAHVEAAIAQLPAQCQLIFRMSRFEELKYQEIADQLGLSVKTVENQIGKALKILRVQLADYLPALAILNWRIVDLLIETSSNSLFQLVKNQQFNN